MTQRSSAGAAEKSRRAGGVRSASKRSSPSGAHRTPARPGRRVLRRSPAAGFGSPSAQLLQRLRPAACLRADQAERGIGLPGGLRERLARTPTGRLTAPNPTWAETWDGKGVSREWRVPPPRPPEFEPVGSVGPARGANVERHRAASARSATRRERVEVSLCRRRDVMFERALFGTSDAVAGRILDGASGLGAARRTGE